MSEVRESDDRDMMSRANTLNVVKEFSIYLIFAITISFLNINTANANTQNDSLSIIPDPETQTPIPVKLIESWQKLSFKLPILNCQFKDCCSNFSIRAFRDSGNCKGTLITLNRIIRCNPMGCFCYSRDSLGYLIDDSNLTNKSWSQNKRILSKTLMVVPGANKALSGKWSDGVFTTSLFMLSGWYGVQGMRKEKYIGGSLNLLIAGLIYSADIYWSVEKQRSVEKIIVTGAKNEIQ